MMPVHLGATASIWVSPPTTLPIITFVPSMQIFPGGSDGKASVYNAGEPGSIPWSGRSPGERNGYPLQYYCLKIPWTEELGSLQSMGLQRVRHD